MFSDKNRKKKAIKIEAILKDYLGRDVENYHILDLGCGSGKIGQYFSNKNEVGYADVSDERESKGGRFYKIQSHEIGCGDKEFDIVISNMVIEHTGARRRHLSEIHRILKDDGVCYLGSPNRIFPIEPHYKIPFIHYLPATLQVKALSCINKVVKITTPIEEIYLPSYFYLKKIIKHGFCYREYTADVLVYPEKYLSEFQMLKFLPYGLVKNMVFMSPTNIFILWKK